MDRRRAAASRTRQRQRHLGLRRCKLGLGRRLALELCGAMRRRVSGFYRDGATRVALQGGGRSPMVAATALRLGSDATAALERDRKAAWSLFMGPVAWRARRIKRCRGGSGLGSDDGVRRGDGR